MAQPTPEEIIAGNRLIAESLGAKPYGGALPDVYHALPDIFGETTNLEGFKFHCDWAWIMPVLVHINKSGAMVTFNMWTEVPQTNVTIHNWNIGAPTHETEEENPIMAIWLCVVNHFMWKQSLNTPPVNAEPKAGN